MWFWEISFLYKLYILGSRTERCRTPACISQGVDSSPSTANLNVLLEVTVAEKRSAESLYNRSGVSNAKSFFDIQEYRSRGHTVIEIQSHVIRKPHTLKCRAVTCTKAKLTCM
jgi:hypothetical protein